MADAFERRPHMLLLIVLAVLALLLFGAGFVVKWLFILAAIAALLFLISLFMGGWRGRTTY
jgi:energy-coupling factor transporter transmembrane protein EcfT